MPDPDLHGNHDPCPACEMRRERLGPVPIDKGQVACNFCAGMGWLPLGEAEICRRMAAEAQAIHWPAFDRRNAG